MSIRDELKSDNYPKLKLSSAKSQNAVQRRPTPSYAIQRHERRRRSATAPLVGGDLKKDSSTAQLGETIVHPAVNQTMPVEAYSVAKLTESGALKMKMQKM